MESTSQPDVLVRPCGHVDHLGDFARLVAALPGRHPRRLAVMLAQLGLLFTATCFCVSIVGMNIGLGLALAGCVLAGAPLHRCVAALAVAVYIALLAVSIGIHGEYHDFIPTAFIPVGLVLAQVAFHPDLPGAGRVRRAAAWLMTASIVASAAVSLGQFIIGRGAVRPFRIDPEGVRFFQSSGFFSLHLTQGAVAGLVFFLLAPLAPGMGRAWWGGRFAAVLVVGICGARAAMLGFALAAGAAVAARGRRFLLIGGAVTLVLLFAGFAFLREVQPARLASLLAMRDGRWPIWQTSLRVIAAHPLVGTGGTTAFHAAYLEAYPPGMANEFPRGAPHAHNTQLALAAEYGIPVAVAWLAMLLLALAAGWRCRASHPVLWRAALGMSVMALAFGQFEKLDGEASRVMWTGLGMLLALRSLAPAAGPGCGEATSAKTSLPVPGHHAGGIP